MNEDTCERCAELESKRRQMRVASRVLVTLLDAEIEDLRSALDDAILALNCVREPCHWCGFDSEHDEHEGDCRYLELVETLELSGNTSQELRNEDGLVPVVGVGLIMEERWRQVESEGWDAAHDAEHTDESLALAAAHYAVPDGFWRDFGPGCGPLWPDNWEWSWDKKGAGSRIRDLVKAGALIAAEIDRLHSAEKEVPK